MTVTIFDRKKEGRDHRSEIKIAAAIKIAGVLNISPWAALVPGAGGQQWPGLTVLCCVTGEWPHCCCRPGPPHHNMAARVSPPCDGWVQRWNSAGICFQLQLRSSGALAGTWPGPGTRGC